MKGNPVLNDKVWKEIEEFPGYEVSNKGDVRNTLTGRHLSTFEVNSGYKTTSFTVSGVAHKRTVHRLVAKAFCVKPEGCDVVNHIDGDKLSNCAVNLEWTTNAGNLAHARAAGLTVYNKPTQGLKLASRSVNAKQTPYLGVSWDNARSKWLASVVYDKRRYGGRRFTTDIEAAKYRDSLVKERSLPLRLNFD